MVFWVVGKELLCLKRSFSWEVTNKEPLENSQVERTAGAKNKEFGKVKEEKENHQRHMPLTRNEFDNISLTKCHFSLHRYVDID